MIQQSEGITHRQAEDVARLFQVQALPRQAHRPHLLVLPEAISYGKYLR